MSGIIGIVRHADRTDYRDGWWRRRTGLVVPAVLFAVAIALAIGTATMVVPSTATPPGPQVFPAIVAVAVFVMAVLLTIDVLRKPEPAVVALVRTASEIAEDERDAADRAAIGIDIGETEAPEPEVRPRSNRLALGGAIGTVVVFIAALQPLGWIISAAFLFWGVARSLGSRRPVFDIFVAFAISSIVQLVFSGLLELNLAPGILAGVL